MEHLQHSWAIFWGLAGFMAGIAVAFFLLPLWQSSSSTSPVRRYRLVISAASVFLMLVVGLYLSRGEPEALNPTVELPSITHGKATSSPDANAGAGSMEQAAMRLAIRLRDGSGSDADWNLLKQSYEFIGDTEGASLAQQHRVKDNLTDASTTSDNVTTVNEPNPDTTQGKMPDTDLVSKLAPYQQRVGRNAKDSDAWLAIAELNRTARNYSQANAAYEHVIALKKMTASSWADYADSTASLQKSLNNPHTIAAIDSALKLNPDHIKALWLKASLLHETSRFEEAAATWNKLLTLIPQESSDYRLVENNLNEARSLAGGAQVVPTATATVSGTVDLDASVKGKAGSDMLLFVYAKPVDSPGPPAAVLRMPVKSWPVNFSLDDSLSMMPTRKLSMFKSVNVQARLSRSGQALPQAGDIQSDVVLADTASTKSVKLRLSKVIE